MEAVRLALAAEVAADYFTLRALDAEKAALAASIEAYGRSLELTRNRRAGGLVSDLDVAQAAFFPTVRFNGLAGFQSIDAGTLFDWPSRFGAVGPSLTLPLFEGGQRQAKLRGTKAADEESVARYRQTVLTAFAEVEDNLAAQGLLARQYEQELEALASARTTMNWRASAASPTCNWSVTSTLKKVQRASPPPAFARSRIGERSCLPADFAAFSNLTDAVNVNKNNNPDRKDIR